MMQSLLTQESAAQEIPASEPAEFEIVLGRRQVASVLFVATVMAVVLSALSYFVGKAMSPEKADAVPPIVVAPPPAPAAPVLEATIVKLPEEAKAEPPLFAEPLNGAVYIQIGALDKGISIVVAEGLRKHGFDVTVAPGPSEKVYRVLIGPLPDPAAFQRAKDAVDQLGLTNFARKYVK
jgi:cell division septation protein DedD